MANESTVQVKVNLSNWAEITVPERDLIAKEVPFYTFQQFYQHFFVAHNLYPFFKFGNDYNRWAILDLSNQVVCSIMHRNIPQFIYMVFTVRESFRLREVDQ